MELELGLKITKAREDVSSSVDFRFSKDPFGPLVLSRETDSRFIIIIHLKGFKKEGIDIEINDEGNRITVQGRKPVEEMVLVRWMAWRKEVELRAFRKVFRIPDTVDLDKIKARFDEDDATLTITMPKRVKGISGFKIEEEDEDEERVDFGDVSEAEKTEEIQSGEEVKDENIERENSDDRSEMGIQREEEAGAKIEETEDDHLEAIQQIEEKDKILEFVRDQTSQQDLVDSNTESEDKIQDSCEQTRREEQGDNQVEMKSEDFGSRALEETEEQQNEEELDRTSKSKSMEKEMTDDGDDDGLKKVQGIQEPKRRNEEKQIQEMVEEETSDHEKKKVVKMEVKSSDAKEEVDEKMGERFTPNIERTQEVKEDDKAEIQTKSEEFESDKPKADEVDKRHDLIEKQEEKKENANKETRETENLSLIKLQEETEEQHSKGQKRNNKLEKRKELVEEKTPMVKTNIGNAIPKPAQEIEVPKVDTLVNTSDEGKEGEEKKKNEKMGEKIGDAKEEVEAKMSERFTPNIAEIESKANEFGYDKLEANEFDKIHELVEEKDEGEETAKGGAQNEDLNSIKLQEIGERQFQRQKRHDKKEKIKKLMEEQTSETETNIGNDTLKPVQEICERKHKNQAEDYKEKIMKTGKKINDVGMRTIQELNGPSRCEKESKTRELAKRKTNDEEKRIAEGEAKELMSYKPKILGEHEKAKFSENKKIKKEDETAEKKTETDDDGISEKMRDVEQRDSDAKEEVGAEMCEDFTPNMTKIETNPQELEFAKLETVEENDKVRRQSEDNNLLKQLQEIGEQQFQGQKRHDKQENIEKLVEEKTPEADIKPVQEIEKSKVDTLKGSEEKEIVEMETKEQESYRPKILSDQDKIQEVVEEEKTNFSKKVEEEEEISGKKTEFGDIEQRNRDAMNKQEEKEHIQELVFEEKVIDDSKGLLKEKTDDHGREEDKEITESAIEAEHGSLRKIDDIEPKIHKECDKTQITGAEETRGQEKEEKESHTITENENSTNIQKIKKEQPNKPKSHGKRYKIQELLEEERQEEKLIDKEELVLEKDSSKKAQEIEKQESNELNRSMVQDMMQETEEKDKTKAMEEKRTKTKDGDKRQEENKFQEPPDLHDFERLGKQSNIPQLVEEEKVENKEDESSGKFREFEEEKSYEDWIHEEREKRKDLVKEEATDPKDKHSGGEGHNDHKEEEQEEKVQEITNQECDELQRSMVQDKIQETEETRAMEEDGEDLDLGKHKRHGEEELVETEISDHREKVKRQDERERHCKQRKIHQMVEDEKGEGKMEGEEIEHLVKEEPTAIKDNHSRGEERYEKVSETKKKVEDEINKKARENKEPESDKKERYMQQENLDGLLNDGENEKENLVDGFTGKIQETEIEESHEKLDIVQDFVEDETEDQEDEKAEEAVGVVAKNENGSWRKIQTMDEQELEEEGKHKEQNKIPETSDPKVIEDEDEERVAAEKETKEQEAHVQELEEKTENFKDDDGEKGKQGETVETKSDRKIRETKVQESKEKKNQEPEDRIEELEKKETSNDEVNPMTEDDDDDQVFLEKESSNVSKRRSVDQENFQQLLKEEEKREDEEKAEVETKINDGKSRNFETYKMVDMDESEENKKLKKIREPTEEEIQDKIDNRIKEQENKGQEPYELLKNRELDKIPEYHREEEKGTEEMKGTEDVSSRKVEKIVAQESDGLEEHRKLSEIKENHNNQEHREGEMNEERGYKARIKTKPMKNDSSPARDFEEKESDQPERYTEEEEEEYYIREKREQKEKAKREPQVEAKANDESSKKNETERLRGQRKKETNDQRKEDKEETKYEYDSSRKIHEQDEERNSDKVERNKEEEMSGKLAEEETGNAKEENRAGDDGFGKGREIEEQELESFVVRHREQDKKQSLVEKDTKENQNHETNSRDDRSRNARKQESHEERDKKNVRPNYSIYEEDGKEDKQISEAELPRTLKGIANLVEEEEKKSMTTKVSAKAEDHESKGLRKQDKSREQVKQRLTDNRNDEETKSKDSESRKIPHINEQERLKEQARIKELVEDKEEKRDEKREKIQELVDRETSDQDDEEELEVEYEDSEEDWDAEVIQEVDSDEDNDKIRQISRIKLGFRLVGGSALFMSLIVIVIRFIRSKKKIKCYKF